MFTGVAIATVAAAVVALLVLRAAHDRRYAGELADLGFEAAPEVPPEVLAVLSAVRLAPRRALGAPALAAPRRLEDERGAVHHGRLREGSGEDATDAWVFVVPRPGSGPDEPIAILTNPGEGAAPEALASAAASLLGGRRLALPPHLSQAGIVGAVADSEGGLVDRLDPRILEHLARAGGRGFAVIELARDGVVLTVAPNHLHADRQAEYARAWPAP